MVGYRRVGGDGGEGVVGDEGDDEEEWWWVKEVERGRDEELPDFEKTRRSLGR